VDVPVAHRPDDTQVRRGDLHGVRYLIWQRLCTRMHIGSPHWQVAAGSRTSATPDRGPATP